MPAPKKILDLVHLFQRNADEYKAQAFNEANLRIQFIDPMFKELGWDMANEQGHAEAYKEVIHEAALKIGEENKAPDYLFRIGGTPKFYLEAKKPAVNIKDDPSPAYQLRRYAWSAKFPLSILTDFEEFAIYDGRVKPSQTDKASAARIVYMRFDEYADKWNEIADVFAREAILRGSFDKYADSKKGKRGTATVDAAFLEEIEGWREELAKNFALRNPKLSSRELNYAVQITIDRIIFLRMCEDRGIEPYGTLRDLADVKDIYGGLFSLFRQADDKYNSGLFHLKKESNRPEGLDALTPSLKLDDKVLKALLGGLYYPKSPYVFSKIPTEILGQVYEQFLGKVIRLTDGHQAKVEEKPEVKKAGGVYYTPTYIVDYIVKHTVGKLLGEPGALATGVGATTNGVEAKTTSALSSERPPVADAPGSPGLTPKQAAKLRILDPACGSGSFLLGA
jgi:Type I restriction enzyme R protein N terminus (HSDR_N)